MKRFVRMTALAMVAIFIFAGCSLVTVDPEKEKQLPVAEVNGDKILKADYVKQYDAYINAVEQQYGIDKKTLETSTDYADTLAQMREDIVEGLITQKLVDQQAKKNNIALTDDDKKQVKDQLQQLKDAYGEEAFADMLKQQQMTEAELEQLLQGDAVQQKLFDQLTAGITVTDEEVKKYYDENKDTEFTDPEMVKVSHILISIPEDKYSADETTKKTEYDKIKPEAEQVLAKAKAGDDFAELVKQYSDDAGTKDQGGTLTFSREDQIEPAFIEASFALKNKGDISGLVQTSYGYHIIRLEEKIPSKVHTFEEKKQEIHDTLLQQKKNDKITALIEEWKKGSDIKKYEKNYK
ncbi:peptidylprolyl isomerase [Mahella australiensis]|uniref:peptidylprolyl isomerase n=1 Tax=Mahella australiensis (strain DSM 15567 / CIP 107919 / 50-1 BON) TaxID=697281 RepID=F4A1G3_MAHA5|nr:peptidylprolyl isomerase [Mahella australiensis]AEE95997.1 PpiC-type peptidyl-prolyl cis-trans isomerase [Mahella australiensis 50-1 BON]